ncbi:hypothetical protein E1301_Tti024059 [Triplophysa tibetana]|uniref:Uncharacterized protein n=1 Tax=Triplophysa tibetana TaxID=1572043 RepID=A0A5A9NC05_9TELE|nr:hypothetical protein E1301_Tti024059 [Triplophysa tibetana]
MNGNEQAGRRRDREALTGQRGTARPAPLHQSWRTELQLSCEGDDLADSYIAREELDVHKEPQRASPNKDHLDTLFSSKSATQRSLTLNKQSHRA